MLFDLQTPGRRRVIKIAFGSMAAIFALSFVFLGVGSGGAGLGDVLGGGGGGDDNPFESDINAAEDKLALNPKDPVALAELVQLHYQAGTQQIEVDDSGQQSLTETGQEELQKGADAWTKYQKVSGDKVDTSTATLAVQTFAALADAKLLAALTSSSGTEALDSADDAVANWTAAAEAQQVLVTAQPTSSDYSNLAFYFYRSGQIPQGDQAAQQAVALAKGAEKEQVQQQLDQSKQEGEQLTTGIAQLRKTQQQQAGATGGGNPLEGLGGGGGLGAGGLSTP